MSSWVEDERLCHMHVMEEDRKKWINIEYCTVCVVCKLLFL